MILDNKEWWVADKEKLLNSFSDACEKKIYKKIPYEQWRKLSRSDATWFLIQEVIGPREDCREIKVYIGYFQTRFFVPEEPVFECSAKHYDKYNNDFANFLCDHWNQFKPTKTKIENNIKENNDNMKTDNLINFEFGPVSDTQFRISPYGIAVATNSNGWVSYNSKTEEVFNVDIINFDASKLIYKMPVAINDIKPGDILMHSARPVFVRKINDNGTVSVVNYANSTVVDILPIKSPFGFNFFTKICSLIDLNTVSADADNPFGNILPFLMFSNNDKNFDPMILLLFNKNFSFENNNPMLLYFLLNNDKRDKDSFLPFLFLNGMNNPFATAFNTNKSNTPAE